MSTLTVTTQAELDAALQRDDLHEIIIDSPRGMWLYVSSNGSATVRASDSATVEASGSATVRASDWATVEAWDSATVRAWDSATVRAWDSATVRASDSATVEASDSATVEASGSATVRASDSATVRAWGSATVRASDSATVRAWGSATVRASDWVAVHLHSACATVSGGHIINVADLDLTDPQTWCSYHGVEVTDGIATLYKAVGDNWSTDRGTDYSPGSLPEAHDWEPIAMYGKGLHFSPSPIMSRLYYPSATRFLAVGVAVADLIPLGGDKAKAPRAVRACVEVDIDGKAVAR